MSLTPADLAQLQTMINASVEKSVTRAIQTTVQPLADELGALKRAAADLEKQDRKHSGVHRDLLAGVEDVRKTGEHAKLENTEYLVRTLDAFRKEMLEAAKQAPAAAQATQTAATSVQVAADSITTSQGQTRNGVRINTLVTILAALIIALLNHFSKG